MSAALKGQHPAREEGHDQIIRGEIALLLVLLDEKANPDGLLIILRIMEPVLHAGWPGNIFRKVDEVFRATVSDVEEGFLPGPDGLQTGEFVKRAPLTGRENAALAPDKRFGSQKLPILDRILPEVVEKREIINRRSDTSVSLHESSKGRKVKDRVARKMVGLKLVEV
jgi:hypothetical protein